MITETQHPCLFSLHVNAFLKVKVVSTTLHTYAFTSFLWLFTVNKIFVILPTKQQVNLVVTGSTLQMLL